MDSYRLREELEAERLLAQVEAEASDEPGHPRPAVIQD